MLKSFCKHDTKRSIKVTEIKTMYIWLLIPDQHNSVIRKISSFEPKY